MGIRSPSPIRPNSGVLSGAPERAAGVAQRMPGNSHGERGRATKMWRTWRNCPETSLRPRPRAALNTGEAARSLRRPPERPLVFTGMPSHDGVETNTAPRRLTAQQERRRFGIAAESASVRLVLAKHGGRAPESRPRSGDRRCSDSRSDRARRPVSAARAGRDHQRLVNRSCKPTGRRRPAPKDRASGCWRPG